MTASTIPQCPSLSPAQVTLPGRTHCQTSSLNEGSNQISQTSEMWDAIIIRDVYYHHAPPSPPPRFWSSCGLHKLQLMTSVWSRDKTASCFKQLTASWQTGLAPNTGNCTYVHLKCSFGPDRNLIASQVCQLPGQTDHFTMTSVYGAFTERCHALTRETII